MTVPPEPSRARRLVLAHGWNATAYQILNPGIDHWFSAAGDAVVGYVRRHRVRVVAGAPVSAEERLPAVVEEFAAAARRQGDRVCYIGAEARLERVYREDSRSDFVLLGSQPVFDPELWEARRRASVRANLNRARNKGVTVDEWPAEKAAAHPALTGCLAFWLARRGLPPMHFLVEPDTLSRLEDRRVFVAIRSGVVVGFLVASPVPARDGWLIEQIIRGEGAANGTADLLIDRTMRAVAAEGSRYATLGMAPLSHRAGTAFSNPPWIRPLIAWARAHGRRFYNFDGLDAFKAKFDPVRWDPVFAIAHGGRFSPRMLYAMLAAFAQGSPILAVARGVVKAAGTELSGLTGGERSRRA
ncbi:MAG: DUF2156 domain-containing protein [Gemmatimonadota bacterium]